ncbi:MAG TPA: hypothetical protein VFH51_12280, partial [Myxococcota bacterium]|nr:hypothetical protein [Myxococcota bacterium]
MTRASLWLLLAALGCAAPVYDPITATELARRPMRVATGERGALYYPEGAADDATRVTRRLEGCLGRLRDLGAGVAVPEVVKVVVTDAELNNAYVLPAAFGSDFHMVLPMHMGIEALNFWNLGLNAVDDVSCHEAVHYAVLGAQTGFWSGVNAVLGAGLPPAAFLPVWLHEGMATYYEGRLGKVTGRMASPLWRGRFAAGARGGLAFGHLHPGHRQVIAAGGGQYVVGSHFVSYLAETYGEAKLWELVSRQSRAVFAPVAVSERFEAVYGQPLPDVFDAFARTVAASLPARRRPAGQEILVRAVGNDARLAACPAAGLLAALSKGPEQATRLALYDADGSVRWSRRLTDLLPQRATVVADPQLASGLSFTADCRSVYLTLTGPAREPGYAAHVWELDATSGARLRGWGPLRAVGGGVSPAGDAYALVAVRGSHADLQILDLATDAVQTLALPAEVTSPAAPSFSPDGTRLAFAARTPRGFNLFLRQADGALEQLTDDDAFNYQPKWLDDETLLFNRGLQGRLQAHRLTLADGALAPVSDAPDAVLDVAPWRDGRILFLSAEGWGWNIEAAPVPLPSGAAPVAAPEAAEAAPRASRNQGAAPL